MPSLSALDFDVIREHLGAFERNGFAFAEATAGGGFRSLRSRGGGGAGGAGDAGDAGGDDAGGDGDAGDADDGGAGGGGELLLAAVPYSKGVTFGEADVAEVVELLAAGEGRRDAARPSKWASATLVHHCAAVCVAAAACPRF